MPAVPVDGVTPVVLVAVVDDDDDDDDDVLLAPTTVDVDVVVEGLIDRSLSGKIRESNGAC